MRLGRRVRARSFFAALLLGGCLGPGPDALALNFGVGRGLTAATDDWSVKAIVGISFN